MPYSIPSFTRIILTLATAAFSLILVGVLYLSVNLLWCQVYTFYCPLRKKSCSSRGHRVHIQQHIHQSYLNLCLPLYYYSKFIAELEKNTKKEFKCEYGAINMTKYHFEIPICFWFQLMSLSNLFLKLRKFGYYLGCGCITFNFIAPMNLRHLLPMLMNKKLECKDHQIYSKMLRKICKKEVQLSFIRVIKNPSFDKRFSYLYG